MIMNEIESLIIKEASIPIGAFYMKAPWYWSVESNKYYENSLVSVTESHSNNESPKDKEIWSVEFKGLKVHAIRPCLFMQYGKTLIALIIASCEHKKDWDKYKWNIKIAKRKGTHLKNESFVQVDSFRMLKDIECRYKIGMLNDADYTNIRNNLIKYIESKHFYFYHLVPKGADVSKGLLAPYALAKIDQKLTLKNLDKYRDRMVNGWNIYPNRDPESLSLSELLNGLDKFRGEGGTKTIYFFKFAPYKELGSYMTGYLNHHDIYRIDLNNKELHKYIENIYWGNVDSHTDKPKLTEDFYRSVSRDEYFSKYDETGRIPFAPIPHIGITFKNGICPRKFLTKIDEGRHMINSHDEMSAMMEVKCNDKHKPFLEKIVTETGQWPSWMNADQIEYVQENGFDMKSNQPNIESLKEYAEKLKADGLISWYDINDSELRLSSISGKHNELEDQVKASISSLGAYSYYKIANRGRMPVPGYPKFCIRLKSEVAEESYVAEASKPKDYKIKGQLLFRKLDTATIKRHIRSCPALKNAKTGPGIKSLVIIKLGGFGRTYREYVGEIAGYVTCNSKGDVLSRWVSPKAKNFGINAKLDAFVKKPVIENQSCFVTQDYDPINEAVFRDKKNLEYRFDEWANDQIKILLITGFSGSGKTTLAEKLAKQYHCKLISVDLYGEVIKKRHPELNNLPKEERQKSVVRYIIEEFKDTRTIIEGAQIAHCDPELIKSYACIFMGTSFLTSNYRLWKRGFVDTEREAHWAGTTNPVLLFLHALFKSGPKNTYANTKFYSAMNRTEDALSESTEIVSEGIFDRFTKDEGYTPKGGKPWPGSKDSYKRAADTYRKNKSGKYTVVTDYPEIAYFNYSEDLCKKIAMKHLETAKSYFYHSENTFGDKHLGRFMVGGDDGHVYCPELGKWFYYNLEDKVPININRPVSFGSIMAHAKSELNDALKEYYFTEEHASVFVTQDIDESYYSDSLSEGNPGTMHQPVKTTKMHRKMMSRKAMKPMNGNHRNIVSNESTSVFVTENNDTQPLDILEKDEVHYHHKMYMTKKDFDMRTEDPSKEYDPPRNFNNLNDIAGLELQTFKGYKDLNDDIKIIFHSGGDYNRIGYIRCPESGIQLVKKWMADCSARSERFDYFIKDSKGNGGKFELWFNPKTYHNSEC